jgi:mRNA-degrading endonuclease toxin of MazEF toxin-antitoxin module
MIQRFQWVVLEAELDPARGSGQAGRRPVLVVSNEPFNRAMPNITVLPLNLDLDARDRVWRTFMSGSKYEIGLSLFRQ